MKRHNECEQTRGRMLDLLASGLLAEDILSPDQPSKDEQAKMPAELTAHLQQCSTCAAEWNGLHHTWRQLDSWSAPEPSPYFDSRLQARLREEKLNPQRSGMFAWLSVRWRPALAALAVALVIVVGALRLSTWRNNQLAANEPSAVADLQDLDKNADVYTNDMLYDDGSDEQQPAQQSTSQ